MGDKKKAPRILAGRRRKEQPPLEVRLSVKFKFGDEPHDVVTVMDDRAVPMVDGVFKSRDLIIRTFATMLVRAGMAQPKVLRELVPMLRMLQRSSRPGKK